MSAGFSGLEKLGQEVGQKRPWDRGKGKMPSISDEPLSVQHLGRSTCKHPLAHAHSMDFFLDFFFKRFSDVMTSAWYLRNCWFLHVKVRFYYLNQRTWKFVKKHYYFSIGNNSFHDKSTCRSRTCARFCFGYLTADNQGHDRLVLSYGNLVC